MHPSNVKNANEDHQMIAQTMRLHTHRTAPPRETNNVLSTERRRRKASCGAAASLIVTAAATALVVFLAASSISGRREMGAAAVADLFRPNAKRVPPAQRLPDIDNTIGEHADNTNTDDNMEQTQQHPRRNRRRLEDTGEEIDEEMMDQHRGHHHDEGHEENTGEFTLSENKEEPAAVETIESKEPLDDSDSDENQDGDIAPPQPSLYNPGPKPESSQLELSTVVESITEEEQIFQIQEIAERLRPRPMLNFDPNATKQFAHLHHMKTGGTSINHLLNCALDRARTLYQQTQTQTDAGGDSSRRGQVLPFYSLEECSHSRYLTCTGNDNSTSAQSCRSSIESASVMQYCAPLHQMSRFDWLDADIVSVIRHPVDRVWSMFRFQTKSCFQCTPLLDIYRHIEEGTLDEFCGEKGCGGVCIPQLLNHETRNLLTDTWDEDDAGGVSLTTDEEKLQEALFNLKSRVTLVGVTDELPVFAAMLGKVFPWLAESVTAEELGMDGSSRRTKLRRAATSTATTEPKSCPLSHANASPENNRCAPGNKHWDLPDEPDEETREAILRHNQLDLKIYEAAKARFQLQKEALGFH